MISGNLKSKRPDDRHRPNARWQGPGGDVLVEIRRTNNVRDIRSAMLALAYILATEAPTTRALCVLTQSRLSQSRINEETERFRSLVRPDVAQRIRLIRFEDAASADAEVAHSTGPDFLPWLEELLALETASTRATRQTVASALALSWLRGAGPMTAKALQVLCRASYPTVAAAIAGFVELDLLEQQSDRRVTVRYISVEQWMQIAQKHAEGRQVRRFIDPSGQARTPDALMSRLFKLQRQGQAIDVAVGGVLGARRYFPELDITASPRLDLSVYSDGRHDFVRHLDAALELATDARAKAVVVVHITPEPPSFIDRREGGTWASELECCADLVEMGLTREAQEMMGVLSRRHSSKQAGWMP